jgi:hypothetical protein
MADAKAAPVEIAVTESAPAEQPAAPAPDLSSRVEALEKRLAEMESRTAFIGGMPR